MGRSGRPGSYGIGRLLHRPITLEEPWASRFALAFVLLELTIIIIGPMFLIWCGPNP